MNEFDDLDLLEDVEDLEARVESGGHEGYPATTVLVDEHKVIKRAIDILVNAVKSGVQDEKLYLDLARFFSEYADAIHHGKEENILFEYLKEHAPEHVLEIVKELENDHVRGRELVGKIRENASDVNAMKDYALAYASMLRDHIMKEDEGLFAAMHPYLPREEEEKMMEEFRKADPPTKKGLEVLVEELEKVN